MVFQGKRNDFCFSAIIMHIDSMFCFFVFVFALALHIFYIPVLFIVYLFTLEVKDWARLLATDLVKFICSVAFAFNLYVT